MVAYWNFLRKWPPNASNVIPSAAEETETADGSTGAFHTTTGFSKSRIIGHPSSENGPVQPRSTCRT